MVYMAESRTVSVVLCVDVLFELFQYFYVDELFHLFSDSFYHFPSLLKNGNIPLHVRYLDAHFRRRILPHIERTNVISIRVQNLYQISPINLSQFTELHLLVLHNVSDHNWPCYFPNKLKHLELYVRSTHREKVLKKALSLHGVERLEFNSTALHFHDCPDILDRPSTIKHLVFKSQRCFIDYPFLLNNAPYLRSLKSFNTYYPHRSHPICEQLSDLHTINLDCKHLDLDAMIALITGIAQHSLRRCRLVNTNSRLSPQSALDSRKWHHWLEEDSPQLKKLEVLFQLGFYHKNEMLSAIKTFNRDPYFQKIDFKLQPTNAYQAMLIGNCNR